MKGIHFIALLAITATPIVASGQDRGGMVVTHSEPLQVADFSAQSAGYGKPGIAESRRIGFNALGRAFELELEANDRLFAAAAIGAGIEVYRGRLAGNADSWVRLTIANGMPRGLVWDGRELFAIEAPGDSAAATSAPVIFRLADTYILPGTMTCGSGQAVTSGAAAYAGLKTELGRAFAQGPGATVELDLGVIGDFDFASGQGDPTAAIVTRFNNVDGIYSSEIGVQISVEELTVFTDSASDPFSNTTDASTLLDEVGSYRQATPAQSAQGLTHLYTGRNLDGTTVGLAFTFGGPQPEVLCHNRFGAALTQATFGATTDALIAAHEIGHNFGAPHDGEPGSACAAEPTTFLMAPSVNGSDEFSQCSINIMSAARDRAACITPLPSQDMTIGLVGQAPSVFLGDTFVLDFNVTNQGTIASTNVAADFTIPGNFSFGSVSSTSGTCTNGAGTVNCQLGTVPGAATTTVSITTTATDTNTGTFVATVTTDTDDNPNNNQDSVMITPTAAVDLAATTSAASVTVNQATAVRTTLENRTSMDATNVDVNVQVHPGLRLDSVNWPAGSCTITGQEIDCQAAVIGGQSSSQLTINVTALTAGQRAYTVTITSNDTDSNANNNVSSSNVTVNSVNNGGDDDGGSGSTGLGLLFALALILAARRRVR